MRKSKGQSAATDVPRASLQRQIVDLARREVDDFVPLVTPVWLGCKIGRSLSVIRDLASGQLLVWCPINGSDHLTYLDTGIGTLFCQPSEWLTAWFTGIARTLDRSSPGGADINAFEIGRATGTFARSSFAAQASARVLDLLDFGPDELGLALRLDPKAKGTAAKVRFGAMQNVLRHRETLYRLGMEQPQWLQQAATWVGRGFLCPNRDLMAQIKAFALTHGLSKSAWRALAKRGGALMDELPATSGELKKSTLDESIPIPVIFHAAIARHWVGDAWQELHPEFRHALVRELRRRPGNESMEPLLRAIGHQLGECASSLDQLTVLENKFSEMVAAMDAQREDDEDFALEYEQVLVGNLDERDAPPTPPKSTKWRNWECWLARFQSARNTRYWVPLHSVEGRDHVALAIETRAELIREGERMEHCVGGYAKRCAAGRYVVYTILDTDDAPVATLGVSIEVGRDDAGNLVAQSARFDEVSGYDNDRLSRVLRRFSEQVVCEVNLRLPQPLPGRLTKRPLSED